MMEAYDGVVLKPSLDEALAHYGVPGMRWGHRKQQLRSMGLNRKQARRVIRLEKENNRFQRAIDKGRGTDFDRQGIKEGKRAINDIMKQAKANKTSQAIKNAKRANSELSAISKAKPGKGLKTRQYEPMAILKTDSSVTKRVKADFNNMTDQEFMNKYKGSKKRYQKRVKKYGDPYKHTINSTAYKMLHR